VIKKTATDEPKTSKKKVAKKAAAATKKKVAKKAAAARKPQAETKNPAATQAAVEEKAPVTEKAPVEGKAPATKKVVAKKKAAARAAPKQSVVSPRERYEMIATMAYYRAEARNFAAGYAESDWFECEQIIDEMLSKAEGE
jgi:hypothetical protein